MACKNLANSSKEVFDLTWCRAALKKLERKSPQQDSDTPEKAHPELGIEFCLRTDHALSGITGMHKLVDNILVSRNTAMAGFMYRHSNSQCLQENQ